MGFTSCPAYKQDLSLGPSSSISVHTYLFLIFVLTSEDQLVHEVQVDVVRHQLLEPASEGGGAALAAEVYDPVPSRDELPATHTEEGKTGRR